MEQRIEHEQSNPESWRIWGIVLIVLGLLGIASQLLPIEGQIIGMIIPFGFALTFGVVYITDRSRWWALIPAWVFLMGGITVLITTLWPSADVAIPLTLMMAVPFLVVYLVDRSHWWALIPAYVFIVAAVIVLASNLGWGVEWIAPTLVGLPFIVVYATNPRENWWALIPAGIMLSTGAGLLIGNITLPVGALLLIAGGLWLLLGGRTPKKTTAEGPSMVEVPSSGPEADKPRE